MVTVNLLSYRVNEITFINKTEPNKKIQLGHEFSYKVAHQQGDKCVGEITYQTFDKNDRDSFSVKIVFLGFFSHTTAPQQEIHVATFKELLPFLKTAVANITTCAGLPPIIPPTVDISNTPMLRMDNPSDRT